MVSFSCEVCNDTMVKRRLIPHFNRCPNAYFTCIDCNTTFQGDEFQRHTQCISEDQKYQGKLYKAKAAAPAPAPAPAPASASAPAPASAPASAPTPIKTKPKQSLYKIIKGLKKTHKLETKQLLKKIVISPEGSLELLQ